MTDIIQAAKEPLLTTLVSAGLGLDGALVKEVDKTITIHLKSLQVEEELKQKQIEVALKELDDYLAKPSGLVVNPDFSGNGGSLN